MTFDEFVSTRLGALLRYATAVTCDPHLAEDVVQEVLLRAQSRWQRISGVEQPEAYLRRMVLNEFLSWRRRLQSRSTVLREDMRGMAGAAVADPATSVVERDAVVTMIAALPPRQRAVIALRFYEGLTDREIANLLGCSEATVRSHASRALATLRRRPVAAAAGDRPAAAAGDRPAASAGDRPAAAAGDRSARPRR